MSVPAWNDTFTQDDDLSNVAFVSMFVDAANERWNANGGTGGPGVLLTTPIPHPSAGDDFQDSGVVASLQVAVEHGIGTYVDPLITYDGTTYATDNDNILTLFRWGSWTAYCTARRSGNSWTRKYPREFATLVSTTYTDGGAFANGHRARNVANDIVYDRTAGAWVPVAATDPLTPPDTVTAYGRVAAGDYIGPWLFTELRDAMNDCVWFVTTCGFDTTVGGGMLSAQAEPPHGQDNTSMANAYADGVANFPATGDPSSVNRTSSAVANIANGNYNPGATPKWGSGPLNQEGPIFIPVSGYLVNPPPICECDLLVGANYPGSSGTPGLITFECPFGYPFHTRHKLGTFARASAPSTVSAGTYGNVLTCVTNPPPDPLAVIGSAGNSQNGWRGAFNAVVRCDVTGGYTYHA